MEVEIYQTIKYEYSFFLRFLFDVFFLVAARFSGRPINPAEKEQQKQHKKREKIVSKTLDFVLDMDDVLKAVNVNKKLSAKKKSTMCDPHKWVDRLPW